MFDVFIMEKITGSGFACFINCSNDQADGEIWTPDLLITNENHISCANLSPEDLSWENPLKSAHWIASLYNWVVFDWGLKIQTENKTVAKTVAIN